jgi:hypothetical protein
MMGVGAGAANACGRDGIIPGRTRQRRAQGATLAQRPEREGYATALVRRRDIEGKKGVDGGREKRLMRA